MAEAELLQPSVPPGFTLMNAAGPDGEAEATRASTPLQESRRPSEAAEIFGDLQVFAAP